MKLPCVPAQIDKFPFTKDEAADIWNLAQKEYFDKGLGPAEAIEGLSRDLGMRKEHIAQAFTDKVLTRNIPNHLWAKAQTGRDAISKAKSIVENMGDSQMKWLMKKAYDVPRSGLTLLHSGAFAETHMGSFLFDPARWGTFFKTSANAWRFMSQKQHVVAELRQTSDPYYPYARRASNSVDFATPTVGILSKMGGLSGRGFNALKVARLDLFKQEFKQILTPEQQRIIESGLPLPREQTTALVKEAKPIMDVINTATGEVPLGKASNILSKFLFSPKLPFARTKAVTYDLYQAHKTFANWKDASPGERQAARFVDGHIARNLAFYSALLAVNEGINQATGSKDHVNFVPGTPDFAAFKVGGVTIRPPNDLIETLRLASGITAPFFETNKQLRGETPAARAGHNIADYLRYKLHPTIQLGAEVASGVDLFGRPVPYAAYSPRALATGETPQGNAKHPPIPVGEYLAGKGPLPAGAGIRDLYDQMREQGMDNATAKMWLKAILITATESEGIQAHESYPGSQPKAPSAAKAPSTSAPSKGHGHRTGPHHANAPSI